MANLLATSTTTNFWNSDVWSAILLVGVLLISMLIANILKSLLPFLKKSLIPNSVLGGGILLIISTIWYYTTGDYFFNLPCFGSANNGINTLELVTYHCLGLGFVATSFRKNEAKFDKQRAKEVFDTGVTTVATYLIQGICGLGITILLSLTVLPNLLPASGILLPFGYGQGTGQALNYGTIYENEAGFVGGASFGLTIAALGFLSAAIFGVIYLNVLRKKGLIKVAEDSQTQIAQNFVEPNEATNLSMDKLTVQIALVVGAYALSYLLMYLIGVIAPGSKTIVFGFNFIIGTFIAILLKAILKGMTKAKIIKKQYVNSKIMNHLSGLFFDVMIVAGIGAIQIHLIEQYWWVLLLLGAVGTLVTYWYVNMSSKKFFPHYRHEQFLAMFGMLTGTVSTGMILLRELDGEYKTPVADNLVYQNVPAIIFGFPMMLLATYVIKGGPSVYITFGLLVAFFVVMNVILFRGSIFKKRSKKATATATCNDAPDVSTTDDAKTE